MKLSLVLFQCLLLSVILAVSGESGTSILAAKFSGGVVVGTDSRRVSSGVFVSNTNAEKAWIFKDRVLILSTGNDQVSETVCRHSLMLLAEHDLINQLESNVHNAAHLIKKICYSQQALMPSTFVCAGMGPSSPSSSSPSPHVYVVTPSGALVEEDFSAAGSGASFLLANCAAGYHTGMARSECIEFVRRSLAQCLALDSSSGGRVTLFVVDQTGVQRLEPSAAHNR
mmetsp:Transcript_8701/g.13385  ORF Transcript_8701/g.13385 Transcript_8701/m.13385 type:complete len:227 (-) Transcript_8701:43-723(-)|eukprot:CAMPEP_0113933528 /NCGR_PEP_ID=MMETSP1339-20121228/583_1 /TAXON_ID=94617 /ORGANISM="Fibrocapsa japonica" /LENGTH=226 /DNA_ID=CAMNT_0000934819 /DNA_START=87 /DNA_END=767 /DNA_ORIENTATION=- /assembly_acc=CAM_ASM_000762